MAGELARLKLDFIIYTEETEEISMVKRPPIFSYNTSTSSILWKIYVEDSEKCLIKHIRGTIEPPKLARLLATELKLHGARGCRRGLSELNRRSRRYKPPNSSKLTKLEDQLYEYIASGETATVSLIKRTFHIYTSDGIEGSGTEAFFTTKHPAMPENLKLIGTKPSSRPETPLTPLRAEKSLRRAMRCRVGLSPIAAAQILSIIAHHLSASSVITGRSRFRKDDLNQNIASFTLIDSPNPSYIIGARIFDEEGEPVKGIKPIEDGRLTTFLHNLRTARIMNSKPTGNAGMNKPRPWHLTLLTPEEYGLEELIESSDIYIELASRAFHTNGKIYLELENSLMVKKRRKLPNGLLMELNFNDFMKGVEGVTGEKFSLLMNHGFTVAAPSILLKETNIRLM